VLLDLGGIDDRELLELIDVSATGIAVGVPAPSVKVMRTVSGSTASTCSGLNRPSIPAWLRPLPVSRTSRSKL